MRISTEIHPTKILQSFVRMMCASTTVRHSSFVRRHTGVGVYIPVLEIIIILLFYDTSSYTAGAACAQNRAVRSTLSRDKNQNKARSAIATPKIKQ